MSGRYKKLKKSYKATRKDLKRYGFLDLSFLPYVSFYYGTGNSSDYRYRMLPDAYKIIRKHWDKKMAPFVMEIFYMMCTQCYQWQEENLRCMMMVDALSPNASGAYDVNYPLSKANGLPASPTS